jgi:predicted esterase
MVRALVFACAVLAIGPAGCRERADRESDLALASAPTPARAVEPEPEPARSAEPVHVEDVPVPDDLTAFVVRGTREHRLQMVFIPGMCVHPGGYIMSFQHTAAARGDLLAVQGDVSCGGDGSMRRWSSDLDAMDRRIDAAFRASGIGEPRNVVLIGYSQGAERAERLVARWPEKYASAVLLASPIAPSPRSLARANAVVLMAGTYDVSAARMRSAATSLRRASVPATFVEIPGARHGQMGTEPERTMEAALDFVEAPDPGG